MSKKIKELYELIEGIEIAMMTTRRADGRLVSRPMATQQQTEGADLWFVTDIETNKLEELETDPNVNISYLDHKSMEWVSVSGTARISQDRARIHELWRPDWKAWFTKLNGDEQSGTPDDPRIALIMVDAESVIYMKNDKPRPVVLYEVVKSLLTGDAPDVGEMRMVNKREMSGTHH
jgi:general stress protein 26